MQDKHTPVMYHQTGDTRGCAARQTASTSRVFLRMWLSGFIYAVTLLQTPKTTTSPFTSQTLLFHVTAFGSLAPLPSL